MSRKLFKKGKNSGMTLVEIVVVLAIVVFVSGIILFDYNKFDSSMSLYNLADDIALNVRKAQSYAIGARGLSTAGFFNGYGVHFTANQPIVGSPLYGSNKSIIFFTDIPNPITGNQMYDYNASETSCIPEPGNECYDLLSITSRDEIDKIFIYTSTGLMEVSSIASLDITFTRPYPEAHFCYRSDPSDSSCDLGDNDISYVQIHTANSDSELEPDRKVMIITIYNTGQISVLPKE